MTEPAVAEGSDASTPGQPLWRRLAKPVIVIVVSLVIGYLIVGFVGAVDWAQVASSFSRLSWWQFLPLLAALLVRQLFNAIPLSQFVSGLTVSRSVENDLAANLAGTVTPPPGDVVIRIAMFTSWGVSPVEGMAGVTLNSLTFYSVRLLMPAIGLIVLAFIDAEQGSVGLAALFLLLAVAILGALVALLAQERWARVLARSAGRAARRFREGIDPEQWSQAAVGFRSTFSAGLPTKLAKAMAALVAMVLADATILVMALRFAGVGAGELPLLLIVGAFCAAYPLTIMPLFGFGVLDASLLATFVATAGLDAEPTIVAALGIWRGVTLLGTLVLGALVTLNWRRRAPRREG